MVRHFIDSSSGAEILLWSAAVLLALAGLGLALGLVPTAPLWLQVIVAAGVVALVGSVWSTLRTAVDTSAADLAVGVLGILVGAVGLTMAARSPSRPRGAHSS